MVALCLPLTASAHHANHFRAGLDHANHKVVVSVVKSLAIFPPGGQGDLS
jgi:hypothetical protein